MENAAYFVAGIDVHKKMLAVVVANARNRELQFEGRRFGTTVSELQKLSTWLQEHAVQEVVMESTAQYWKPVWFVLEGQFQLWLAQARSNRGPRGRKTDFRDAKRSVSRLLSDDLILSYVPDAEQRSWRTLTRTKYQLRRDRVPVAESTGESSGRVSNQTVQCSQRSAGGKWPTHFASHRSW